MQIIYLDEEEDVASICDQLAWAEESLVLLVAPDGDKLFLKPLDLVRLRRYADDQRLELGLATTDGRIAKAARGVGIPVFRNTEQAQRDRRGWWRGKRRRERVGEPTRLDPGDRENTQRRLTPAISWRQWALRYAAILAFFFGAGLAVIGLAYAAPGAVITLRPEQRELTASRQITADPQLSGVDLRGAAIPARELTVTAVWRGELETTGLVETADAPARGKVLFANLTAEPVVVPAGTRVSAGEDEPIIFQTLAAVQLAGVVGATAEADIIALLPGAGGNLAANEINRVEGELGERLEARNVQPLSGGGARQAAAVALADQERLRSQTLQQLQALALTEMSARLTETEFLGRDSIQVTRIFQENYSHFVGERTERLTLEIRAELRATAVNPTLAAGLVYEQLVTAVPPGFELLPDSIEFYPGLSFRSDAQGRVSFEMVGAARATRQLDMERALTAVAGQEIDLAMAYLYEQLPLADYPTATVWPNWFGRLPYLPARIQVTIR
jgi:hypothetical protein